MDLQFLHPSLRDNEEVVTAAVTQNGRALQFASSRLQANEKSWTIAVQKQRFEMLVNQICVFLKNSLDLGRFHIGTVFANYRNRVSQFSLRIL